MNIIDVAPGILGPIFTRRVPTSHFLRSRRHVQRICFRSYTVEYSSSYQKSMTRPKDRTNMKSAPAEKLASFDATVTTFELHQNALPLFRRPYVGRHRPRPCRVYQFASRLFEDFYVVSQSSPLFNPCTRPQNPKNPRDFIHPRKPCSANVLPINRCVTRSV